jgi:aromatic ring-opening dioxygenase catalytic subunit (LigB family)
MPLLGDPTHKTIVESLKKRVPEVLGLNDAARRPRAIVLVTAHWNTDEPRISGAARPELIYDYYGFPPEAYAVKYAAPGEPELAREVAEVLRAEGLNGTAVDPERGWDHGVFVPMKLVRPEADVPIVQVSVLQSEDPERHLRMGRALRRLRAANVAVVGSGFASFHNIRVMMALRTASPAQARQIQEVSQAWNDALNRALQLGAAQAGAEADARRRDGISAWRELPGADVMHPPRGGDHFMPLIVCAGAAAEDEVTRAYRDDYQGVDIYTYYWGANEVA